MGNISYASDEEIAAAWRLLNGEAVPDEFELRKTNDGLVSKLGTCSMTDGGTPTDTDSVKWTVNRELLRLVIARRGIEMKVNA